MRSTMKKKLVKILAVFLAINIFADAIYPTAALALTGGPSQPEMSGFTPIGTSEMVNAFTGDFNYNIPLLDIGGYPLNLSYQSGIAMDQEASWVGLGWSLNPGVIQRNMRALPDDFNGDEVKKVFNMKPNMGYGANFGVGFELAGTDIPKELRIGLGGTYNNYSGFGFSVSANAGLKSTEGSKGLLNAGLGLSAGSESGVGISPSLSFDSRVTKYAITDLAAGISYNSRSGLQNLNVKAGIYFSKGYGISSSSTAVSFANPTYVPYSPNSMLNLSMSTYVTFGGELFGTHFKGKVDGFLSSQVVMKKERDLQAYGYMNSHNATSDNALMDFNREKDGSFNEKTPGLPLTNFTYDVYSVSGQGIGGMYRLHRSDIGIVKDNKTLNLSVGADFPGIEIGAGNTAHLGLNAFLNESNTTSGKWEKDNDAAGVLGFQHSTNSRFYEPAYFKQSGEKTAETDPSFFEDMGGFDPVRINLNHGPASVPAKKYYDKPGTDMSHTVRSQRARRTELMSSLSATEANHYGDIKKIENYERNNFTVKTPAQYKNIYQPNETINRTANYRKSYHQSQLTTYRADGAKYVYGIPAYNTKQDERTFAVEYTSSDASSQIASGLVAYGGSDDTPINVRGNDNYFEQTVLPAYAHSYLLTEILSADYVDVTGNGPTDDDLGNYTKINYTLYNNAYRWRAPYTQANFNEGLRSLSGKQGEKGDDKGSYVYGEKEIWYIHSIETKNYVACFTLEDRADGYGVASEQGGFSSGSKTQKLRKIDLFSKQDLLNNSNAMPLKTVHFEYDYSRCKNIENNILKYGGSSPDSYGDINQGGKLTLMKIYFTYANSGKGKLSPYIFNYGTNNPDYEFKGYDRWGNYKHHTLADPTSEFPYTPQDANADTYATAWHMSSIELPSGGTIKIDYESDDYAYVQDRQAMQMFRVVGASALPPNGKSDLTTRLYNNGTTIDNMDSFNYLTFEIPGDVPVSPLDKVKSCLFEKNGTLIKDMYFKFDLQLGKPSATNTYERVQGYAGIESTDYGFFIDNDVLYGYLKLKEDKILDKVNRLPLVNPISQAGWGFTRMNLPFIAYDKAPVSESDVMQVFKAIASTVKSLATVLNGAYNQMRIDHKSMNFKEYKSLIRLYNPTSFKKGGGSRVKKLIISDNWNSMAGTDYSDSQYGQEYTYTTTDTYGNMISSGVAAYEPLIGGEENPFRQPVKYEIEHKLAASDEFYQEEPYGESFFPGPSVGYSRVTVKTLHLKNNSPAPVKRHASGYVVNEFYTAKDFPVITSQTRVDPKRVKPNPVLKILRVKSMDWMTASQGFVVELNDMHGKPKGMYVYAEDGIHPISGVKYLYKTTKKPLKMPDYITDPIEIGSLDNRMKVLERDGSIQEKLVGVDYDFVADMREQETVSRTAGISANLEAFLSIAIPTAIGTLYPSYGQERVRFRSAVTTKVITRFGILDETLTYNESSKLSSKNTLLDAETGDVLLTETKNQYEDPVYSFNYPAHLVYDGMGPAYRNTDLLISDFSNPSVYFVPGDELEVIDATTFAYSEKAWVKNVTASTLTVIDRDGYSVNLTGKMVKIIRSGRRNQQSIPIGSFVSKVSPIDGTNQLTVNSNSGILNAGVQEFSEDWGLFCNCDVKPGQPFNPYVKGTKGNWRKKKTYAFLTKRTQSIANDNLNTRDDGVYTSFSPFWTPPGSGQTYWQKNATNWQMVSEVSIYSPYGMELENKDALGIYSSAIYGYNNTLPLAVSANAQYKEIGFDSFEDYDFNTCKDDHFSYKLVTPTNDKLARTKSHSGKNSIKLAPNSELQLRKKLISCQQPQ